MPGLLDIAVSTRTAPVGDVSVNITGVSAKGFAALLERFPEFRKVLTGNKVDMTPESLMAMVPDAIAAVIAAGTGNPGDPKAEAIAESLGVGVQLDLLKAIIDVTMPKGVGPFVDALMEIMGGLGVESMSIQDTKSPQPSNT
jgi:hypothetical protein